MKVTGNTVLITGGVTGIGYALAEYFSENENEVIICGRRIEKLQEASKKNPGIHIKRCDIAKERDRKELKEWIAGNFNAFNILVNNAGIQKEIDFTNGISGFKTGEDEILINLEAPIILTGMLIPLLKERNEAAIINISSGLGFVPSARAPVYSATKAGIHAFSMALRYQLAKTPIRVFEFIPPAVDTELNAEGRAKRGNFKIDLKPAEFVSGVMEAFKSDIFEAGYGMTRDVAISSREEIDRRFQSMNSRW